MDFQKLYNTIITDTYAIWRIDDTLFCLLVLSSSSDSTYEMAIGVWLSKVETIGYREFSRIFGLCNAQATFQT